jgi:hydroxyacylglutathione hydrolase
MRVITVPCLRDNYAYLVICDDTGTAAVIDPGAAPPVVAAVAAAGVTLRAVWATHHHADHVGGVAGLLTADPTLTVVGHHRDRERIAGITLAVDDGDRVSIGAVTATIVHNPGHTDGAISYVTDDAVFTGDTLFGAGCGRLFEGTAATMQRSLARLAALPVSHRVYFGHEYTAANLRFARTIEPDNPAIDQRATQCGPGTVTTPSTIGLEQASNPFLRSAVRAVADSVRHREPTIDHGDPAAVFAALRRWKDEFR